MRIAIVTLIVAAFGLAGCEKSESKPASAAPTSAPTTAAPLKARVDGSFAKAAEWVVARQGDDGAWKSQGYPSAAFTSLCVYALAGAPDTLRTKHVAAIDKGIAYLTSKVAADGSIAEADGTYRTYATSLYLMALTKADPVKHKEAIVKAQQHLTGKQTTSGLYKGGSGYGDTKHGKEGVVTSDFADLSNTAFAAEALKLSGLSKESEYWKHVAEFVGACQNNSETNADPELLKILAEKKIANGDDGGIRYTPTESRAGEKTLADGTRILNSYGSMTYAGLKVYLYANLKKDDPRVKAAAEWLRSHYTLDYHPGFDFDQTKRTEMTGIYYYYMMMARALAAWGENPLMTARGEKHDWAKELAEKLLSLQTEEGGKAWKNVHGRWEEGDPLIATSYALIVYSTIGDRL